MPVKLVVNGKEMDAAAAGFLSLDEDAIHEWARAAGQPYDRTQQYVRLEVTVRKQRANDVPDDDATEGSASRDGAITKAETEHQTSGAEAANAPDAGDSEPAKSAADAPKRQPKVSLAPRTATGDAAPAGKQKAVLMEGPQGFASNDPKDAKAETTQKAVGADPTVKDVDKKAPKA